MKVTILPNGSMTVEKEDNEKPTPGLLWRLRMRKIKDFLMEYLFTIAIYVYGLCCLLQYWFPKFLPKSSSIGLLLMYLVMGAYVLFGFCWILNGMYKEFRFYLKYSLPYRFRSLREGWHYLWRKESWVCRYNDGTVSRKLRKDAAWATADIFKGELWFQP